MKHKLSEQGFRIYIKALTDKLAAELLAKTAATLLLDAERNARGILMEEFPDLTDKELSIDSRDGSIQVVR